MHDAMNPNSDTYTYATIKSGYEFHPIADIFPMMSRREFDELVADIDAHGQQVPIWTFNGSVIDGRNRYKACLKLNLAPMMIEWEGEESELVPFIVSLNLKRRHLKAGQRSMVAAKLANINNGGDRRSDGFQSANLQTEPPVSQTKAADLLSVSTRTVADAKTVQEKGSPELIEAVERGEAAVSAAAEVAKTYADEPEKQKEIVEAGRVTEAAKEIKESKKSVDMACPSEIIATVISEVEALSQEFQDLDVKEMGVRFTSILDQLADALHQLDRRSIHGR
jgi:hypothetical protein